MLDTRAGEINARIAALREARLEEGMAALLLTSQLVQLRDARAHEALGTDSLATLIARDTPALDRRSLRALLLLEPLLAADQVAVARFGLSRLGLIAQADPELREQLIAGPALSLGEISRALREASGLATAARIRNGANACRERDPLAPRAERTDRDAVGLTTLARQLTGAIGRTWREVGDATWKQARLVGELWQDTGGDRAAQAKLKHQLEERLAFDDAELKRALALFEVAALVPIDHRHAAGIGALRALADMTDPDRRTALIAQLQREKLSAAELLALCRPSSAPRASQEAAPPGAIVDDPSRLVPFSMLYVPDPGVTDSSFAEATPAELVEQVMLRATRPGATVLDLTAGSGTVAKIAARMGRSTVSVDVLDPPLAPGIIVGDARTVRPEGAPFELVFVHPPLPGETIFSERYTGRALPGDLSLFSAESYARAMADVLGNAFELTRSGGTLALICREARFEGRLFDWPGRLGIMAERAGFVLNDRLYVPLGPASRAELLARLGFLARRERRTLPVVLSALLLRKPERSGMNTRGSA